MTAEKLIDDLRRRDVHLTRDGDRIRVDAPAGLLTDEVRAELRWLKPELLKLLQHEQEITASGQQDESTAPERALMSSDLDPPSDWLDMAREVSRGCGGEIVSVRPGSTPDNLPADWRVWFEERAAVREFDGGQAREHAEAEALKETIEAMRCARDIRDDAS